MAVGDPWNNNGTKNGAMQVFIPSSAPIISSISIDSLMSHFDDLVFDKSDSSHIRHLVEVLCGESGIGQILAWSVRDWLNGGVYTAWLGFVDRLFASIYGLPRIYEETTKFNPSDGALTIEEVNEALVKESWYKERFVLLMKALCSGGTVRGFRFACQSICFCDCDIYETWRYKKQDFQVGRMGYTLYNEVVICPYSKGVTERQKELLLRVLDRLKPADVIVTINMNGLEAFTHRSMRAVTASSTYFEIQRTVMNTVDNSKLPPASEIFTDGQAYGYDAYLRLDTGETTEVRKAIQNRTQEYTEYYVSDKSSTAQVADVTYTIENANDEVVPEEDWTERESTVRWSSWVRFTIVDAPDNYPGGKYGRTPMRAPAVNRDGTDYIFPYESQDAYERMKGTQVIADGGEVMGHHYRVRLSVSTTTTRYTPDMSLVTVNDASNNMQVLPEVEPKESNAYSRVTLRNMQ